MTPDNLGLIFGPTLMRPEVETTVQEDLLREMRISSLVVKSLIMEILETTESKKIMNRLSVDASRLNLSTGSNRRAGGRF
jgi:hypothetical protein